ncbi:gp24 [Streptococcus pneumoniae]|nr:gp24 [Streptococcus pneumoniae]VPI44304.1 gp24 [Streptococcus pneumoniae]VPT49288.1 gp24 [Streptococcus pneumoniae]VQK34113.1 gp24 [Streptococcus pneumoniae]
MEELKKKVNAVYNWTVEDGKPQPPQQDLPQAVKERVDYFWEMAEDGMTLTYDVNPAWLVGWIDDEMMHGVQVVEKVVYKESPTARLPDYFNNNNEGKIIKWVKTKRYMGGKVWAKRT